MFCFLVDGEVYGVFESFEFAESLRDYLEGTYATVRGRITIEPLDIGDVLSEKSLGALVRYLISN